MEHIVAPVARQLVSTAHVTVAQTKPFSSFGEKGFLRTAIWPKTDAIMCVELLLVDFWGRVPKSGVSKHFSHLKEVRLFPKI